MRDSKGNNVNLTATPSAASNWSNKPIIRKNNEIKKNTTRLIVTIFKFTLYGKLIMAYNNFKNKILSIVLQIQ